LAVPDDLLVALVPVELATTVDAGHDHVVENGRPAAQDVGTGDVLKLEVIERALAVDTDHRPELDRRGEQHVVWHDGD
jgi:hypothetical protein